MTQNSGAIAPPLFLSSGAIVQEAIGEEKRNWYAIYTLPRHEKKVESGLSEKGVFTFLPLVSEIHRWGDRKRRVSLPLFPGYVFASIEPIRSARIAVLRTRGVVGFVGNGGTGVALPDRDIDVVRNVIASKISCSPYPFLTEGQRVRIVGGSLDGTEGILVGKRDDCSVVISVNLIQRSLAIRVSGYRLEPA